MIGRLKFWRPRPKAIAPLPREGMYHVLSPFKTAAQAQGPVRINLILPSIHRDHLTGGPATLVNYVVAMRRQFPQFSYRLLPVMVPFTGGVAEMSPKLSDFVVLSAAQARKEDPSKRCDQAIADAAYKLEPITLCPDDVFIATMWPTQTLAKALQAEQQRLFGGFHKAQYVIQDYEPAAIYSWSDLFVQARETYADTRDTIAVVGTSSLAAYLEEMGHHYEARYVFEPGNNVVRKDLPPGLRKDSIILVYCRPDTPRNCFNLIGEALLKLTGEHPALARSFQFISVGEAHRDYQLNNGAVLRSRGFLPVSEYNDLLLRAAVGCFFVVSPHSGYVAIEMARSGMVAVSNSFETKDVAAAHPNIRAVPRLDIPSVTESLIKAIREVQETAERPLAVAMEFERKIAANPQPGGDFPFIAELIANHYSFPLRRQ